MSWLNVQTVKTLAPDTTGGGTATQTGTWASNITSGNRILLCIATNGGSNATGTIGTPSDSAGNTYTKLVGNSLNDATFGFLVRAEIWSAPITVGGGTKPTITVTASGASTDLSLGFAAAEYSGLSTASGTSCLDTSATATGIVQSTADVSAGTTAAAGATGELVVSFIADGGGVVTWTIGSSSPTLTKNTGLSHDGGGISGADAASYATGEGTSTNGSTTTATWHNGSPNVDDACACMAVIKLAAGAPSFIDSMPLVVSQALKRGSFI